MALSWVVASDKSPSRTRRRIRRLLIVLAIPSIVAAGVLWSLTRSGDPFAAGTRTFSGNGIAFSYPAGWIANGQGWASTGLGSTFAIVGTQPWGLCLPTDINCHDEVRLEPSQITVNLALGRASGAGICDVAKDRSDLAGRGPDDPPATGHLLRVAGRPTLQTDYAVNQADYYHADAWRIWVIAAPGSTTEAYTIEAMYRGPGDDMFRHQLDDLIASLTFNGPPSFAGDGPADCGAPFPR
jgi:hypothetical protein